MGSTLACPHKMQTAYYAISLVRLSKYKYKYEYEYECESKYEYEYFMLYMIVFTPLAHYSNFAILKEKTTKILLYVKQKTRRSIQKENIICRFEIGIFHKYIYICLYMDVNLNVNVNHIGEGMEMEWNIHRSQRCPQILL